MLVVSKEASEKREVFFQAIFGDLEGWLALASLGTNKVFKEEFFEYPRQMPQALDFIQRFAMTHNVYFSPTLFSKSKRLKEYASISMVAWADLDSCAPEVIDAAETPTIVVESSPNRYQAFWRFTEPTPAGDAEEISRRIAYKYHDEGADISGWDLTQLLRVPFTLNHKYGSATLPGPTIKVTSVTDNSYTYEQLKELIPQALGYEALDIPMPDETDLPQEGAEEILLRYRQRLQPQANIIFATVPDKDWSKPLWQLELFCLEAGMTPEETFVVARASACNKYERDGHSEARLWKEVCKAVHKIQSNLAIITPASMEPLLSDEDRKACETYTSFVDEYIDWAKGIGDAAPQYHQAGAFIILSSLLAGPVTLPTSFGTIVPNLWFMILADTTLTRKSTAMDLAMDIVAEVDDNAVMATDGSIEGLFGALALRPKRPSVFLRDEFSGLLEMMTKKDYYAGMAETLTKLYDGKYQKRILRRDVIEVRDPVLIVFAGGIRERILQLLQYEHVASGFLPRFCFITAESDLSRLRPLGPPTEQVLEGRGELIQRLTEMHAHYASMQSVVINGKTMPMPAEWKAELTPDAWMLYNHYESSMMEAALTSKMPDLMTPTFDRLSKSGLKASILLAAQRMDERIIVTEADLMKAFSYVEYWRQFSLQIIENLGRTSGERILQNVMRSIDRKPGITRSEVMQSQKMTAREAEQIMMTLEQRGLINRIKSGRTERLYSTSAIAVNQ